MGLLEEESTTCFACYYLVFYQAVTFSVFYHFTSFPLLTKIFLVKKVLILFEFYWSFP